jgi:hypothetical protein
MIIVIIFKYIIINNLVLGCCVDVFKESKKKLLFSPYGRGRYDDDDVSKRAETRTCEYGCFVPSCGDFIESS